MDENCELKKTDLRVIIKYEFFKQNSAAVATRNINAAFGRKIISERMIRLRFERFRTGNFDLNDTPRGRPVIKVDNKKLKAAVEADPTQSAKELAEKFHVSKPTILKHLSEIGKIKRH